MRRLTVCLIGLFGLCVVPFAAVVEASAGLVLPHLPFESPSAKRSLEGSMPGLRAIVCCLFVVAASAAPAFAGDEHGQLDTLITQHASANNVPESLVRRVILRESRYNPRAVNAGNFGLMQIRLGTARRLGYRGTWQGLLDADTNMTYAVRYLAGAYRAAHGNATLAVALYARGY
jgi:soluble lytic murein transglycosylase-like protein